VGRPSPGLSCEDGDDEDSIGDEHYGLRLWGSGTRSHPVEDLNLRETRGYGCEEA